MKKTLVISLLALTCVAAMAQKKKDIIVRASNHVITPVPSSSVDKKSKLETIEWRSTENNSWHENIGIINNVPIEKDLESIYNIHDSLPDSFISMSWRLTDEGKNTVLHCYFLMKSDIVTNLWLGNAETTILDKETGIIYQARSTVPEKCYNKVFGVKGKKGTALDLQIIFPRLPESAKNLAIYGVPNWFMRGTDVQQEDLTVVKEDMPYFDQVPDIHLATKLKDSNNYDKDNHETWAVYNDAHTIKPVKEKTMALWRTPEATYLAIATEQNWIREYFGHGEGIILLDNKGHQYKCTSVMGYPFGDIIWLEGYPGDYFAIVLVFEPLPLNIDNFTYIEPEGEPFNMWAADWSGEVIPKLEVSQLRKNQKLFEYHPRVVIK